MFSNVSIEERIPANHPLRRSRKLAHQALDRLNPTFCQLYASEGRPSVPPEQLLPASLLQAFYGIRSGHRTVVAGAAPLQPAVPLVCRVEPR
jgi:transposase